MHTRQAKGFFRLCYVVFNLVLKERIMQKRLITRLSLFVVISLPIGAIRTPAYAQLHRSPAASNGSAVASDVFKVQYFDDGTYDEKTTVTVSEVSGGVGGLGDGLVRTINPTSTPQICEMVYVFDSNEEQQECCGCVVTNDGLRVQSVERDLTSNPSNGQEFFDGIIKIVSSLPNTSAAAGFCNPALAPSLTPALRPSISHSEATDAVRSVSVQSFDDSPLDQTEINTLVATCAFIHTNQSGAGRCTCGRGDVIPATAHAGR